MQSVSHQRHRVPPRTRFERCISARERETPPQGTGYLQDRTNDTIHPRAFEATVVRSASRAALCQALHPCRPRASSDGGRPACAFVSSRFGDGDLNLLKASGHHLDGRCPSSALL